MEAKVLSSAGKGFVRPLSQTLEFRCVLNLFLWGSAILEKLELDRCNGRQSKTTKHVQVSMPHAFGAEQDERKRRWMQAVVPGALVYNNVLGLASGTGESHEGNLVKVPRTFSNLSGGFPCTSSSRLYA